MNDLERKAFEAAVYDIVRLIPAGRATSYGAIAKAIGYPSHSRMVGAVMARCNSDKHSIPAHRVVNSQGILSWRCALYCSGKMQALLEAEGVKVENDRIKDWDTVFWNPIDEIVIDHSC